MKHWIQLLTLALLVAGGSPVVAAAQNDAAPAAKEAAVVPDAYVLTPSIPNPFNSSTRFSLTVTERQNVRVAVFNMLGQEVKELYSGPIEPNMQRTFTFDGSGLPSGIYLYRVQGNSFSATRQVMLVK